MSIQAMAWVLEHSDSLLADRLVLIAIANHANAQWDAWPAVTQIAHEARVDRATVFRSLTRLVDLGELEVRPGRGRGNTNQYHLKGSQDATQEIPEKVASRQEKVASTQIKGRSSATQNRQEPSEPKSNGSQSATVRQPQRCADCGQLEFDCLCDRGPLIQGLGRRPQPEQEAVNQ